MNFLKKMIVTLFVAIGAGSIGIITHPVFGFLIGLIPMYFIIKER